MTRFLQTVFLFALGGGLAFVAKAQAAEERQLVLNPSFEVSGQQEAAEHWTAWTPDWQPASCRIRLTSEGLRINAPDEPFAVGGVWQDVRGIKPGLSYRVEARCHVQGIESPLRSVYVRLTWIRQGKPLHPAGMLLRGPIRSGKWHEFSDTFTAPQEADGARLSLELKWPRGGSVCLRRVSMKLSSPPAPRNVKIGTVFLRPRGSTPAKNLELFCDQVDAAGKLGLDIVCLGEAILTVGTAKKPRDVAEPIPGPSTERLGRAAKENNLWVVAGLTELAKNRIYNTAVLIDRNGKLAGTYRKVHLPREEWKQGITPGREYPVFQTDFGTVAIQICYDWFFPEPETIFGLRGAEVVFAPTWGNTLPDEEGAVRGETVFRVRARDNGIYLVPSVYDGNSMVIGPMGRILATSKGREGVFWAEVDLNRRESLPWVGHWRSIGPRHRMPSTYGPPAFEPHK